MTAFRKACEAGIHQALTGSHSKRVLLILSDGEDTSRGNISQKDLKQLLLEKDVQIYALDLGSVNFTGGDAPFGLSKTSVSTTGVNNLDNLTSLSGGRAYHPQTPEKMQLAAEMIAAELRHQYLLAFTPASMNASSNSFKVKVKLTAQTEKRLGLKGISVRHREEFFSNSLSQSGTK